MTTSMGRDEVVAWLLDGDPAIRWQALRDLTDAPDHEVAATRARWRSMGWGAELLDQQDPDGRWAGALYSPKWTSTTYTLLLLHWLGLGTGPPRALAGCQCLWDGARFFDGGLNLAKTIREPETCITGMLVLLASSFGLDDERVDPTVKWLLGQQMDDGGWNCETIRSGSRHGAGRPAPRRRPAGRRGRRRALRPTIRRPLADAPAPSGSAVVPHRGTRPQPVGHPARPARPRLVGLHDRQVTDRDG